MWRFLVSQLFDEAVAMLVLHRVLRHRLRPPVRGTALDGFPDLYSGDIDRFYRPAPVPVDLGASRRLVGTVPHGTVEDAAFRSHVATDFPTSDVVRLRHWKTNDGPPRLTVIGVDGIVQLSPAWFRRLAAELLPAGIDVVMMDAPFNHRRTPAGYRPGQLIVGGDLAHQLSVSRQAVIDLWTTIESLRAEGRRVGLIGLSYGGWLSLTTSLVADGLDFVTALIPPVDMYRILQEGGTIVRAARRGLGRVTLGLDRLEAISRVVSPIHWTPRLDPARITLHAARYDRFVPPERIVQLSRQWGANLIMHDDGHMGVGTKRAALARAAADILQLAAAEPRTSPADRVFLPSASSRPHAGAMAVENA